jgi:hypothetical protein
VFSHGANHHQHQHQRRSLCPARRPPPLPCSPRRCSPSPARAACTNRTQTSSSPSFLQPAAQASKQASIRSSSRSRSTSSSSSSSTTSPTSTTRSRPHLPTPASNLLAFALLCSALLCSGSSALARPPQSHGRRRVQHQQSFCSSAAYSWPTGGAWTRGRGLFLRLPLCGFDLNLSLRYSCSLHRRPARRGLLLQLLQAETATGIRLKICIATIWVLRSCGIPHLQIQASPPPPPPHFLSLQPCATPRQLLAPKRRSRAILDFPLRSNNHGRTIQAGV